MSECEAFWNWFKANEPALFESAGRLLDGIEEPIWQALSVRMSRLHPSLSYLVSDLQTDGIRELFITASGDRDAVPWVAKLHSNAPTLPRWRILKYRPRHSGGWDLAYEGRAIDRDGFEFVLFTRNQRPSLMVFARNYAQEDEDASWYQQVVVPILVDQLLGEEDSMWLEEILLFPWDDETKAKRYPLRLLPTAFEQMKQKLPATRA